MAVFSPQKVRTSLPTRLKKKSSVLRGFFAYSRHEVVEELWTIPVHVDAEQMTEIRQRIEGHPPQEFSDQKDPCKIGYATSHNVVQQHSSSLRDLGHMKNNVYCMLSQKIDLFAICAIVF